MKKFRIIYDTNCEVNKVFEIEAVDETCALDAFYYEIETEETVERKCIMDLGFCD